jgi:tight adherence protein C
MESPFIERVMRPLVGNFTGAAGQVLPQSFNGRIGRSLDAAGWRVTPAQFMAVMVLSIFLIGAMPICLSIIFTGGVSIIAVLIAVPLGMAGFFLPLALLRRAARKRRVEIWKSLPDACDLITLCVEAGLGLDGALRLVSQKLRGPLAAEMGQTLREIGLGRPRRDALQAMADRADVPELETFVQSLIQTDALGTSLGGVLRSQGISLRGARRRKAEELVRKAPVKMVFPLVLFTIPSFFIITIGPIVLRVINALQDT